MRPGTYIAAVARPAALALVLLAGCGGAGAGTTARAPDGPLTVYLSAPRDGIEARAGQAVAAGAQLALDDARGRVGDRAIRLVQLDSAKPKTPSWDPEAVEANAKRATDDPSTIAYIGELSEGGSAISVPLTNDAGILQVSPLDGLTTLTRDQPGAAPGTGPARYYPRGNRTFMRLIPTDALQAEALVGWARERGARRLGIVQDEEVFGRVLAQQVVVAAGRARLPVTDVAEPHDDPSTFDEFALKLAATRPDALLYTGLGDPQAGLLLGALDRAMPAARRFGSSALATASPVPQALPEVDLLSPLLPAARYGPRARALLKRISPRPDGAAAAAALYGYESMRVVLDALAAAGPQAGDRSAVVRAALTPRTRRSVIGTYRVLATGDVAPARFGTYRRSATGIRFLGERFPRP